MPNLVAIDLPGGDAFVDSLRRIWDRGDAALPVDQRLPRLLASELIEAMGAGSVIDQTGEQSRADGRATEAGDALVVATSGSTGRPKGVVLTHESISASAIATSTRIGVSDDDRWLACLPLSHVGGLAVVTRALHLNTPLTVLARFDASAVTRAAADGCTLTSLVSTTLSRIDPTIFRMIVLGGSQPPADQPPNTVSTYGLTETGSGVVYDGVPLQGVEVRIADDGEILLRCPMQLRCYRDGTSPVDPDGWLHTDDVGSWDDDEQRLHVDGRRGDLIITGGENVWPDVVERVLLQHPLVADVGVAGVDDPEWGQAVTAWVVPVDPTRLATLQDLRIWSTERLPAFMAPRSVVITATLPRTSIGKLQRSLLR